MSVPAASMQEQTSFLTPEQTAEIEEQVKQKEAERLARVDALGASLMAQAITTWGLRQTIEERWLEDLRQYNGAYDEETLQRIKANEGSQLYINLTRPKCKTVIARMADMLFPTDDRNWAIQPTPVPELQKMLKSSKPLKDPQGRIIPGPPDKDGLTAPLTEADRAANILRKAREAAEGMQLEIDDQLTEAKYPAKCREVIKDGVVLGTGVLKAPIVVGRTRRKWTAQQAVGKDGMPKVVRALETVTDPRPSVEHVDIWNFFPDMAASNMAECRFVFERKYLTHRGLAALARDPYYIASNIKLALAAGVGVSQLSRNPTQEKRGSAYPNDGSGAQQTDTELFEVWEYHGPLDVNDLRAAGVDVGDDNELEGQLMGCVVFVGPKVIKAYLNPLETGSLPYKVFNYEKDESSIFGYGIPYRMRNSARAICAAWRAIMDNAGLSTGPQIVVNKKVVEPANGSWTLTPRKVWYLLDQTKSVRDAFGTHNIDSHQAELQAIIELASRFADEETGVPLLAQGEQGPTTTKTAQGMALLNNNSNTVNRATVKNFDDDITAPVITDFYDWNMQNSDKEHIKGDYEVDARGSSVLLSKEIQSQNLMMLAGNFAGNPIFGGMLKPLPLFRKLVQSMHVAAEEVVVTDAEYEEMLANKGDDVPPEVQAEKMRQEFEVKMSKEKTNAMMQLEDKRHANRMKEYEAERQTELADIASRERAVQDATLGKQKGEVIKGQQQRIKQADEIALKLRSGGKPGTGV